MYNLGVIIVQMDKNQGRTSRVHLCSVPLAQIAHEYGKAIFGMFHQP